MYTLTEHFTIYEAEDSDIAIRHNIDNRIPDEATKQKIINVARYLLEPIRENFNVPFKPTSWYRCLELNRLLKSKDTSQHVKGEAVDIIIPTIPIQEPYEYIKNHLDYDQLILEYGSWVHVSYISPDENRMEAIKLS